MVAVALVNPYQHYRQAQVATVSRAKLVMMLYDGAISFLKQALAAGNAGQDRERRRLLGRAQDIVFELWATLDLEAGEVAENLFRLYQYINGRLAAAVTARETAPLEEVAALLSGLREAWQELEQSNAAEQDNKMALERSGTLG